jgi:hypothetical protein
MAELQNASSPNSFLIKVSCDGSFLPPARRRSRGRHGYHQIGWSTLFLAVDEVGTWVAETVHPELPTEVRLRLGRRLKALPDDGPEPRRREGPLVCGTRPTPVVDHDRGLAKKDERTGAALRRVQPLAEHEPILGVVGYFCPNPQKGKIQDSIWTNRVATLISLSRLPLRN